MHNRHHADVDLCKGNRDVCFQNAELKAINKAGYLIVCHRRSALRQAVRYILESAEPPRIALDGRSDVSGYVGRSVHREQKEIRSSHTRVWAVKPRR